MRRCPTRRRASSGQAAVESAIVLPLFVFLILGILQLSLMHQAKLMTKYAAFKAARSGALHSAKLSGMETAALAVLTPFLVGGRAGTDRVFRTDTPDDFMDTWSEVASNDDAGRDVGPSRFLDVTICNPTTSMYRDFERDFDDPDTVDGDWEEYSATRLNVQVTLYYRMPIPFANMVLWWIARGREAEHEETLEVLRMNGTPRSSGFVPPDPNRATYSIEDFDELADEHVYVVPIRESYGLRMQSNFIDRAGFELPDRNACVIPWEKRS